MNLKIWAPLAVAVILGLVAAKVGKGLISSGRTVGPPGPRLISIAVASGDLPAGKALTAADVTVGQLPAANAPAGTFPKPPDLVDRVVAAPIVKGQAILESQLAPTGSASGLTAIVPVGMRAITLEVNEFSGVAGLITPGCHVDVVSTFAGGHADPDNTQARIIAEDMTVIAVGQDYSTHAAAPDPNAAPGTPPPPPPPPAHTITLLATPHDAQLIELASHVSNPRMVLRGSRDNAYAGSDHVTLAELRGMTVQPALLVRAAAATQPSEAPAAASFQGPAFRDIQVIRNGVESTTRVDARTAPPAVIGSGW